MSATSPTPTVIEDRVNQLATILDRLHALQRDIAGLDPLPEQAENNGSVCCHNESLKDLQHDIQRTVSSAHNALNYATDAGGVGGEESL